MPELPYDATPEQRAAYNRKTRQTFRRIAIVFIVIMWLAMSAASGSLNPFNW